MKRYILAALIVILGLYTYGGAVYQSGGGGGAGTSTVDGSTTTFSQEINVNNAPFFVIENTGTGDKSNLLISAPADADPGIIFSRSGMANASIEYDVANADFEFHHLGASFSSLRIDSTGNTMIHSGTTGAETLLLFHAGALKFFNFESELTAGANSSILKSTDVNNSSELFAENENNDITQLTGDAVFPLGMTITLASTTIGGDAFVVEGTNVLIGTTTLPGDPEILLLIQGSEPGGSTKQRIEHTEADGQAALEFINGAGSNIGILLLNGNSGTFPGVLRLINSTTIFMESPSGTEVFGALEDGGVAIFNFTEQPATVANAVIMFADDVSASSELSIQNEAGQTTRLSGAAVFPSSITVGSTLVPEILEIVVPISAASFSGTVSNGIPSIETGETATNLVNYDYVILESTSNTFFEFSYSPPPGWDEGTVTFEVVWTATGTPSGGVAFNLQALARSDDESLDTVYGSSVTVTDTFIANEDVHITATSGAVTIGGTPAEGDYVTWRGSREVADGSDTMDAHALVLEYRIRFTRDSYGD